MEPSESPDKEAPRKRRVVRALIGAAAGSVVLLAVGQAYAAISGSGCALVCNPSAALGYGAVLGALFAAG